MDDRNLYALMIAALDLTEPSSRLLRLAETAERPKWPLAVEAPMPVSDRNAGSAKRLRSRVAAALRIGRQNIVDLKREHCQTKTNFSLDDSVRYSSAAV